MSNSGDSRSSKKLLITFYDSATSTIPDPTPFLADETAWWETHHYWLITDAVYRPLIDTALAQMPIRNLYLIYLNLPDTYNLGRQGSREQVLRHHYWQRAAYSRAVLFHQRVRFDGIVYVDDTPRTQPNLVRIPDAQYIHTTTARWSSAVNEFLRSPVHRPDLRVMPKPEKSDSGDDEEPNGPTTRLVRLDDNN